MKRSALALALLANCMLAESSLAQTSFPLEMIPAAPTSGDSITLRLRPGFGPPGQQAQFVVTPSYPVIERTGTLISVRALICSYPSVNPGTLTRDLVLGALPPATYAIEIQVTEICLGIGPPPGTTWSGMFVVYGDSPTQMPALGPAGLGALMLLLWGIATVALRRAGH